MLTLPIQSGDLIISANNNSRWDFWTNNETQRFVLTEPSNGTIPIAIREPKQEQFSYQHVNKIGLANYLASTRHRIIKDSILPGEDKDIAENIRRLWAIPELVEKDLDGSLKLKEGLMLILLFNEYNTIKESAVFQNDDFELPYRLSVAETIKNDLKLNLQAPKEKVSCAFLFVRNNELVIRNMDNVSSQFYSHVQAFNDLINTEEILMLDKTSASVKI